LSRFQVTRNEIHRSDNLSILERVFSQAKKLITDERNRHHPLRAVADARSAANSTGFVGRSGRGLKIATSRRRMLEKIQKDHYAAPAAHLDEIDEWLSSPPIQEQIPENLTAEADAKWLLAWWRTNQYRYPQMAKITC
jgi:hypothetical protein